MLVAVQLWALPAAHAGPSGGAEESGRYVMSGGASRLLTKADERASRIRRIRLTVPDRATQGIATSATARLLAARKGVRVRLEVKYAGSWVRVDSGRSNRRGKVHFRLGNSEAGVRSYRATARLGRGAVASSARERVVVAAPLPAGPPTGIQTIGSATPDTLDAGGVLRVGQQLVSPNGQYRLVLQSDGNLVVYQQGSGAIWASRTVGSGVDRLVMQGDNNLVMYQGSTARWNTATVGTGARALRMQDDGNVVLYAGSRAIWSTKGGYIGHLLQTGQTLYPGERLYSVGRQYNLVLQGDGNLVLYEGGTARWNTQTVGSGADRLVLQGDGNLVLYAGATAKWASSTVGKGGNRLVMQTDGNLVLYSAAGAVWSTKTGVPSAASGGVDDYPAGLRAPVPQDSVIDPWRFYNRECTSFVAWRLNNNNHVQFSNYMTGSNGRSGHFGNAGGWHTNATAIGYAVNGTPKRGAVAEWPGHVAWVQKVNADGSITIEEYNYGYTGLYHTRTVTRSSGWPSWFIHIRDF
jgi:surface antigen